MGSAMTEYRNLADLVFEMAEIFRPPERLTVAEASEKYVYLHNPPRYSGYYLRSETPYMDEPMEMAMSRDFTAEIFVGPAQSGKSQSLVLNVMAYIIKCNPMDTTLYHMSQSAARDFTKRRVDRMHRHSKAIGMEVMQGQHADNTHDKTYKSGMMLSISWPSINEMSSKPIPVVMFTDYDRMPDDIDGEGSPFSLGQKRTTTFRNLGMTIAESSPGRPIEEVKEDENADEREERGEHEAPPSTGILGLYNTGDRRRWYWPCPECGEFFEPSFKLLTWLSTRVVDGVKVPLSIPEMGDTVRMACPHCGEAIEHRHKHDMNAKGVWLAEGEKITKDGNRYGTPRRSRTVSYWLKGPAARYVTWGEIVVKYLEAMRTYEQTGSEDELKATVGTDQAEPYQSPRDKNARTAEDLEDRANKNLPQRTVPMNVRALFATIDTQGNRWEVQVQGIRPADSPERPYDIVVIDRFKVEKSARLDADGDPLWVKPASYPEDWDLLVPEVMDKTYPLQDRNGHMKITMTFCDSGGGKARSHDKKTDDIDEDMSVTSNAYNFYRRLKKQGKHERFQLIKGDPNLMAPRAHLEYPDSKRKDRNAGARGEIPVLFLNSNSIKDTLNAMLDRTEPGGGMIDFPEWLPRRWFEELTAEARGRRGWYKLGSRRNEAWDLLYYFIGACIFRRVERVDWSSPPPWLAPWDDNPMVVFEGVVDKKVKPLHRLADLGAELA